MIKEENAIIRKIISVDEYIREYNPYLCPKRDMELKEPMCGIKNEKYDCRTCWEIAMGDVEEVEVIYKVVDFKFKKKDVSR